MSPVTIIDKYYPEDNERKHILLVHSRLVAEKALSIGLTHWYSLRQEQIHS